MTSYAGADYIRLTHADERLYGEWRDIMLAEYTEEEHQGRKPHWRWIMGYYGQVGEHCFVGKGEQGAMVQASGSLANHLFYPLSRTGGRASRIDLQMTVVPPTDPNDYLNSAYIYACAKEHTRGRPSMVQFNDTNYGARMVSIGSRQSEVYGRIYDKGKESKEPLYSGMVRLEIEVKGKQAPDLQRFLMEDRMLTFHAKHITQQWFKQRGVPMFWEDDTPGEMPPAVRRTKTDETKLAWLSTQVAPTLKKLCENGKALECAAALLTGCEDDDIMWALAKCLADMARTGSKGV